MADEKTLIVNPDKCIRCLLCFSSCPVIQETMGKAFISPNFFTSDLLREPVIDIDAIKNIIYNCLTCDLCTLACPRNLSSTQVIHYLRNLYYKYAFKKLKQIR